MRLDGQLEILLAHAYFLGLDSTELRVMRPYVPLGILSLAAYLEREGFPVRVFDSTFETPQAFSSLCASLRPHIVGISVNMMTRGNAVAMIAAAKQAGALVVVGGPEPALYAEEFLACGADAVVVGEGEQTLLALVQSWTGDRSQTGEVPHLDQIQGIVYSENGLIRRTSPRSHIADLNSLPVPDRGTIDLQRYIESWRSHHGYASLSVSTMRGCPYTCAWCSHAVYGVSYRRRSPAAVAEELEMLLRTYAPEMIWFVDDVFTISTQWIREFHHEVTAKGLKLAYECISRADRLDEEVVAILRATGCRRLWIGSESGSQRILDRMSRGVTVEKVRDATHTAQRAGIEVGFFLMLGYDGETPEDIEATVAHVRASGPDIVLTTVAYPIKGTRYYDVMRERMAIPDLPFARWNDRMISVEGQLSRRFYWFAHRRLINEAILARAASGSGGSPGRTVPAFLKARIAEVAMRLIR